MQTTTVTALQLFYVIWPFCGCHLCVCVCYPKCYNHVLSSMAAEMIDRFRCIHHPQPAMPKWHFCIFPFDSFIWTCWVFAVEIPECTQQSIYKYVMLQMRLPIISISMAACGRMQRLAVMVFFLFFLLLKMFVCKTASVRDWWHSRKCKQIAHGYAMRLQMHLVNCRQLDITKKKSDCFSRRQSVFHPSGLIAHTRFFRCSRFMKSFFCAFLCDKIRCKKRLHKLTDV